MGKRITQKQIMEDVLTGFANRYGWQDWKIKELKIKGIKHVVQGDNKEEDLHFTFAIPMLLIQESNIPYPDSIDYMVYRPIAEMMKKVKPESLNKESGE